MTEAILQLEDVDLRYQDALVVRSAELVVKRGQWLALVGPNASGKTTLLRSAAGRLPPSRGVVRFAGQPLYPLSGWRTTLPGYACPPEDLPPFLTIAQSMEILAAAHRLDAIPEPARDLARALGLAPYEHRLIRELSLGTRQKLAVVHALLPAPVLLLIDEVFNGLDLRSALALRNHLRQQVEQTGLSVLMATHSLDLVRSCCDSLVLIDGGRLLPGWSAAELRQYATTGDLERALAQSLAPEGPA